MIVKVCGMRQSDNIADVVALGVDMIGFIFYPPSPRWAGESEAVVTEGVDRVGVFVNEQEDIIEQMAQSYSLTHIQLHGKEGVELCRVLRAKGYKVIKAISISSKEDFEQSKIYDGEVDLMLFDTKCAGYGGSGVSFDWGMLSHYQGRTPFLLSGGITDCDMEAIKLIEHEMFVGVDLNSRFEIEPALKDIDKLDNFIKSIR